MLVSFVLLLEITSNKFTEVLSNNVSTKNWIKTKYVWMYWINPMKKI